MISTRQYRLNLDQDEFNFSLLTRNHAPASVIDDIDFIRLNLGVRSRDEDFYQDMIQQFVVVISRDIYPRNIRLKQMEGTY